MSDDRTVTVGGAGGPEPAETAGADDLPVVEPTRYRLSGEHARGGLGRIFAAHDQRLGRTVAVKELLRLERGARARFVREAKITARLQHPSIVPIYEAGRWPSGEPFYAMKLVSGEPLSDLLSAGPALSDRLAHLRHVRAVAEAVAYAHSEGVIHRDLKPSNVIVGEFGETMVIDWGLAKDLRAEEPEVDVPGGAYRTPERGDATVAGAVLGTPAYMPPEQARGDKVDERADVYALGAMLYHVLAGHPPYRGDTSDAVLEAVLAGPPAPLPEDAPPDLATIADRAMAREPDARYATAAALAADLERFETGQLVSAHTYTAGALVRRWLRRHRAIAIVATAALVALAVGGAVSVRRIVAEKRVAERERTAANEQRATATARANVLLLQRARDLLDVDPTAAVELLQTYPADGVEPEAVADMLAEAAQRGVADLVWEGFDGGLQVVAISPDGARVAAGTSSGAVYALDVAAGTSSLLLTLEGGVVDIDMTGDGAVVVADDSGMLAVARGASVVQKAVVGGAPLDIDSAPDASIVVAAGPDGSVYVWRPAEDTVLRLDGHVGPVMHVALSGDGHRVASAGADGSVRVRTIAGDRLAAHEAAHARGALKVVWMGDLVASSGADGIVRLWRDEGPVDLATADGPVDALAVAGTHLAYGSYTGRTGIVDAAVPTPVALFERRSDEPVLRVQLTDSVLVATPFGRSPQVTVLEQRDTFPLRGHADTLGWSALSPDGRRLASMSNDGTVRIWSMPARRGAALYGAAKPPRMVDVSGDGRRWVASFTSGELVFGTDNQQDAIQRAEPPGGMVVRMERNGRRVAVVEGRGVTWRDARTGAALAALDLAGASAIEIAPTGDAVAVGTHQGGVSVWSPVSGEHRVLAHTGGEVRSLAISKDGRWLVAVRTPDEVTAWGWETGEVAWTSKHARVERAAFVRSEAQLATAGGDGTVRLWDGEGREVGRWQPDVASRPNLSGDGSLAVARRRDGSVVGVSLPSLEPIALPAAYDRAAGAGFCSGSPLSTRGDGTVRVWSVDGTAELLVGHAEPVTDAVELVDGARLTVSTDRTLRYWSAQAVGARAPRVRRVDARGGGLPAGPGHP